MRMFLNGTVMYGGADRHLVGDSLLVAGTTTASRYRFHAVDGSAYLRSPWYQERQ